MLSKASVGALMEGFVSVRTKAGTSEGDRLAERYGVRSYPTCWILDADGTEVDEVSGSDAATFEAEVRRVLRGEGTLVSLRARIREAPFDVDARLALADKVKYARPEEAIELAEGVLSDEALGGERAADAWETFGIAAYEAGRREDAMRAFERLVERYPSTKAVRRGASWWSQFFDSDAEWALAFVRAARRALREAGEPEDPDAGDSAGLHARAAAAAARRLAAAADGDAEALARIARLVLDERLDVPEAVRWARKAVDGLDRRPDALDTLARLLFRRDHGGRSPSLLRRLWMVSDLSEAIRLEEEALRATEDPDARAEREESLAQMRAVRDVRARRARPGGAGRPAESPEAGAPPR